MPQFLAVTSKGLSPVLEKELQNQGVRNLKSHGPSWFFEGSWQDLYTSHMYLSSAVRILLPVLDFVAYTPEELYDQVKKCDFTKYFSLKQTFKVEVSLQPSFKWKDSRFVGLKIKDAIVDQFYEKFSDRPNVDKKETDLCIRVSSAKNHFSVSLDLTGAPSLAHRGYRPARMEAPIREHLAAGLLKFTHWTPDLPLVDLMCGSGTFLIEAALSGCPLALNRTGKFSFQKLKNFQELAWDQVVQEAFEKERMWEQTKRSKLALFGFDKSFEAIKAAKQGAAKSTVEDLIQFKRSAIDQVENPSPNKAGVIIVNPPYGHRLDLHNLKDIYRDLGYILKNQFKGWSAWILSPDADLTACLGLKSEQRISVWNGPLECKLLHYPIR